MPMDYWKTPLDFLRREEPIEPPPPPEPEAAPVEDMLPLPQATLPEPQAKKPGHVRSIGTPEQQDRWRQLKAENQAKNESQRQQRLASRGQTPMDYLGGQQSQQGTDFGPMQFMKNRNQAVQRMEQGLKGHYRPKTFEEEMAEKQFGEGVRQFDEGVGLKREALGAEQEYNQGRLGLQDKEVEAARQRAAQEAQQFEANQRIKQEELGLKPKLLETRGQQAMNVEKFKQEQIGQRQAAKAESEADDPRYDRMLDLEDTINQMLERQGAGRPIDEALLNELEQLHAQATREYYMGAKQ